MSQDGEQLCPVTVFSVAVLMMMMMYVYSSVVLNLQIMAPMIKKIKFLVRTFN